MRASCSRATCSCRPRFGPETADHLSRSQHARRVVEQLVNRDAARDELLLLAEIDDDLQNRPAGLDAEAIRIKLATLRQAGGAFARVQLAEDLLDHVGPGARQL